MRTKTLSLLNFEWKRTLGGWKLDRYVYTTDDPRFKDIYESNTVFGNAEHGPVFYYDPHSFSISKWNYKPIPPELEYLDKMWDYKWYED